MINRLLLIMRLVIILTMSFVFQAYSGSMAQKITLHVKNATLQEVMKEIQKQHGSSFFFQNEHIATIRIDADVRAEELAPAMEKILSGRHLGWYMEEGVVVIAPKPAASSRNEVVLQQQQISGKVTDELGLPLEGVTVVIKGGGAGTKTAADGSYQIVLPNTSSVLVFSSVGYETTERVPGNHRVIHVTLEAMRSDLDEVVVIGYGTQKKVNLTGAVSVVRGEEMAKRPVGQTSAALQGLAPGLTVRQQSGQPGRDVGSLLVRGVGTLGSGVGPLVLVDGVEASINNIDANEIESISVLKDASSAAIYGSRAAGGVILVTTKRADKKGFNVDYNTYSGWQVPTDMTDMVNGLDHMNMINEAYTNTGRSPLYSQALVDEYIAGRGTDPDRYPDTDWQRLTMKNSGFMQNHHIGLSSGGEKIKLLGSLGYMDQDGIIPNTNFKRYNLRLNTDVSLHEKFSIAMDVFLSKSHLIEPAEGTEAVFHWMRRIPANQAGVLTTGQYGEGWNGDNPIAKANDGGLNRESPVSSIINLDLKYKPVSWLTASLVYSPKFGVEHNKRFAEIIQTYNPDGSESFSKPARNSLTESYSGNWYNNIRGVLTFDKLMASYHQLTVLGGFQQEDQSYNSLSAYREVFLLPQYQEINAGNRENERTTGTASHWALRSFFGRLNYSFKEKYLLEANARYDGSSRFASGNKYALFPSFSAGWRITQEPFMQAAAHIISDMKVRGSWGRLGNQNIGLYPFAAYVNLGVSNYIFDNQLITGASLADMANSEIKWETTTVSDVGIDLSLWSKLTLSADYYYRKTTDILLQLDIPQMLGLNAPYQNAGVVENKGWDLSLSYRNQAGHFRYNVTINLSDVRNKILDMRGVARTGLQVNHEGYPIDALYGYEAEGLFQNETEIGNHASQFGIIAPGDIKYKDQNGDGKIDSQDEIIMGSHLPRYTYSSTIDLSYKGVDFSVFFQGVGKAKGYLYGLGIMPFYVGGTVQEQHKDRWTPDNMNAAFPRFAFNETNNVQNSTFWLKNAAYLRVKNIQVGYTIPISLAKQNYIKNIRVFASGQNLFTFDSFWDGYDPEGPVSNGTWYPQMKVYNLGLSVKL